MKGESMFRLLRYFSLASLVSIIAATVGLSILQQKLATDDVVRLGEAGNAENGRVLANTYAEPLRAFLALAPTLSAEQLQVHPQTRQLHELLRRAVGGTGIIKIKAYTLDGRTVYSSEARQIGEDKSANAGFLAARAGKVVTEITQRDHFSAFEQQLMERSVLSTYLPIRKGGSEPIEAVLEIYGDVTPFLQQMQVTQRQVVSGVVAILLLLYGVLFLVVRHADRILRRQERQRLEASEALREARDELEQRVAEMRQVDARRERYLALSTLSSDWFWDQDAQFRFIDLDSKSDQFGGIERASHLGTVRWELPYTEPVGTTWELHRAEVQAHRPFRNLLLRRSPPSGVRYINVCGEPVFATDGSFTGYRGVGSDVTERIEAELALRAARDTLAANKAQLEHARFLDALLEALPVGVALVDAKLDVVLANEASRRLQGSGAELLRAGKSIVELFRHHAKTGVYGPGDADELLTARLARTRDARPFVVERQMTDGCIVEIRGTQLPDGHRLTTYTDMTEQHRAEAALRESETRNREQAVFLQTLLDTLPVGVSLVDKNFELVVGNQACLHLLDMPPEMYHKGMPIETVIRHIAERGGYGPGDPETHVAARMALARDPKPHCFERVRRDGLVLEVRGVPLADGSMVSVYTDITERKHAERSLREARDAAEAGSRAKSAFLAVMSHEIRTPMNAVIGLLELLRLSALDAEQVETVDTVRESSKSLLRLIDDVLDFSKIEADKLELQTEPASLVELFDSVQHNFAGVASQKGVQLRCRVDAHIAPALLLDRLRLRQIVNNLLSNAIKFTAQGLVELRAELLEQHDAHDEVRITVRDTGVGIEPLALTRLFEPFSQADQAIERRYGGTGLGLAICKRLAKLMGANIDLQSTPGVGTCFSLTLRLRHAEQVQRQVEAPMPMEAMAKMLRRRDTPSVDAARAEGRLILVVDDHPVNRRILARQLNVLGYAAQTASDGEEALKLWRHGGFGLVLTDCQMPGMDGYQLARAIRALEPRGAARVAIVACTANVAHEVTELCRVAGMDEALTKPVELARLKPMLDRWLRAVELPEPALPQEPPEPLATDFGSLAELTHGNAALERDLLDDFRRSNADDLKAAAQAVQTVSITDVRRVAHRIRGAARTIGASALAQAAENLEQAAQAGDWRRVSSIWPALRQESLRLDDRIAANHPVEEAT